VGERRRAASKWLRWPGDKIDSAACAAHQWPQTNRQSDFMLWPVSRWQRRPSRPPWQRRWLIRGALIHKGTGLGKRYLREWLARPARRDSRDRETRRRVASSFRREEGQGEVEGTGEEKGTREIVREDG